MVLCILVALDINSACASPRLISYTSTLSPRDVEITQMGVWTRWDACRV